MKPKSADDLTSTHEALVDLLQAMPSERLLAIICPLVGLAPDHIASVRPLLGTVSFPGLVGKARRAYADFVVELRTYDGRRLRVVILEVQLSLDQEKLKVWPLLVAGIFAKTSVQTRLLLLTPDPHLRARIEAQVLTKLDHPPIFIGADQIPFIRDYTQARAFPHETILGAAFHSREPDTRARSRLEKIAALRAAFIALETFDPLTSLEYQAIIMSIAPPHLVSPALTELRERGEITESRYERFSEVERGGHSFHRGHEEGLQQGLQQGRQQGQLEMLITLIEVRFGPLEAAQLERLSQATPAELERIGSRLHTVNSAASLFPRLSS